ncbi:MAG: reverse transcriptase domain-containing protein, partial [Burkholderiales bacterium]|nr:reverse transcriptase domain-containing protein [Burkholderiales bacterium]
FRPGRRTTDQVFVLQQLVDMYRQAKRPLFTCFIDFSNAFDSIIRGLLWTRLDGLGLRGRMLDALKSHYSSVRECVKTGQGLTEPFDSLMGVKQGCPLSPTLFGLYIDALEPEMKGDIPGSTVRIGPLRVPLLLYADDVVLLAESRLELQRMLGCLTSFAAGMSCQSFFGQIGGNGV